MHRKSVSTCILLAAYGAIFLTINTLHFQYFRVSVVLYDTLLDAAIAGIAGLALYFAVLRHRLLLTTHEVVLSMTIGLLAAALYAIGVPTVIDRSLSIYILEKLEQRGGGIREDAMARVFVEEYMPEFQLVAIRLTEQLNSGTIGIADGCITLTPRGRRIVAFTRFYRTRLLPKNREIMGKITDVLTDPYRNSVKQVDYQCKGPG